MRQLNATSVQHKIILTGQPNATSAQQEMDAERQQPIVWRNCCNGEAEGQGLDKLEWRCYDSSGVAYLWGFVDSCQQRGNDGIELKPFISHFSREKSCVMGEDWFCALYLSLGNVSGTWKSDMKMLSLQQYRRNMAITLVNEVEELGFYSQNPSRGTCTTRGRWRQASEITIGTKGFILSLCNVESL